MIARRACAFGFLAALVACAPVARPAHRPPTACVGHPPPVDERGRVGWSESGLAGDESGAETFAYDDRNRVAMRTIRSDVPLAGVPCQSSWRFGPPPCAFLWRGGFYVVELEDRYSYDELRRPVRRARTTWLVGPFSIHQRPDARGPRTRVSDTWVRWTWNDFKPATVEAGALGDAGAVQPMSPETYHRMQEAERIMTLSWYDAEQRPMSAAPLARAIPPPPACVPDRVVPGLEWGAIELDGRARVVRVHAVGFGDEAMTYDDRDRVAVRTSRFLEEAPIERVCSRERNDEAASCAEWVNRRSGFGWLAEAEDRYRYDADRRPIARWRTSWRLHDAFDKRPLGAAPRGYRRASEWARWIWRGDEPIAVEIGTEAPGSNLVLPPSDEATRLLDEARHVRWLGLPHPE